MTIGELDEGVGQPFVRVDVGDLAVLDQCGDDCPVVAAFVGASEQGILRLSINSPAYEAAVDQICEGDARDAPYHHGFNI